MAHIGHPLIGDGKYGINKVNKQLNLTSQALCAYKIKFNFKKQNDLFYLNNKEFEINDNLYNTNNY